MNTPVRLPAVGLLLALLLALALPGSGVAATRQIALGVSMANSWDLSQLDSFTANVRKPAVWALWSDWGGPDKNFPTSTVNDLHARGVVPMINWEPVNPSDQNNCNDWSLSALLSGKYDNYIRQWATAARDSGGRVLVRFAHEMNGYWYIWGTDRCTNTPKKFRKVWKKVWNIFRGPGGVGAHNVRFVWSVFGTNKLAKLYPGSTYVDYMGLTAFNWAQPGHPTWRSMVKTMAPTVSGLRNLSTTKPIVAAEMGAGYNPTCSTCDKPKYIREGYPAVYAKWPQMAIMVYFNLDMRHVQQPDWRLESPTGAMAEYKKVAQLDSRFWGTVP